MSHMSKDAHTTHSGNHKISIIPEFYVKIFWRNTEFPYKNIAWSKRVPRNPSKSFDGACGCMFDKLDIPDKQKFKLV